MWEAATGRGDGLPDGPPPLATGEVGGAALRFAGLLAAAGVRLSLGLTVGAWNGSSSSSSSSIERPHVRSLLTA